MVVVLLTWSDNFGKYLSGMLTGTNERNNGALPVGLFQSPAGPVSTSSHEYVKASPLPSVAVPLSTNGVDLGIV